jgi:signal transduction histidine kinase
MKPDRVLVADDDLTFRMVMAAHLKRRGFEVDSANDGREALGILKGSGPFAVLVTDLDMPYMDGLELLHEARLWDPKLEVIVITGAGTLERAIAAMREGGAYDFLTKPLESMDTLSIAVGRAADHRRLMLEREALLVEKAAEAERLNRLVSTTGDAILSADAGGVLTVVNPAAKHLLGPDVVSGREALGSLPRSLKLLILNWQSIGGGRATTVEVPRPSNTLWLVTLTPLASSNPAGGWVMVIRDITHLKRLDELKFTLLAETANKTQRPMIQALVDLAELSLVIPAKETHALEIVNRLTRTWERIRTWSDDLLELMRMESGLGIKLTELDLAAELQTVMRDLPEWISLDHHLQLSLGPAALPQVRSDGERLRRLLKILISRAAHRLEKGGHISLAVRAQPDRVWLEVRDDGPPFEAADVPHLFEKALLGPDLTGDGTGLELAMAKTIVESLGGQVWVRSEVPTGNTLAVGLPVVAPAPASSESV